MRITVGLADIIIVLGVIFASSLGYLFLPYLPENRVRLIVTFAFAYIAAHVFRIVDKRYHQRVLAELWIGKKFFSDRPWHFSLSNLLLVITLFAVFLGAILWCSNVLF